MVVYGIKNCDTVRKALHFLSQKGMSFQYHDLRSDGLEVERLMGWIELVGIKPLINIKSTSWRSLSEIQQKNLLEGDGLELVLGMPTLLKRPLIEANGRLLVGFNPQDIESL